MTSKPYRLPMVAWRSAPSAPARSTKRSCSASRNAASHAEPTTSTRSPLATPRIPSSWDAARTARRAVRRESAFREASVMPLTPAPNAANFLPESRNSLRAFAATSSRVSFLFTVFGKTVPSSATIEPFGALSAADRPACTPVSAPTTTESMWSATDWAIGRMTCCSRFSRVKV